MGAKILLVGRNATNLDLMAQVLRREGYQSVSATSMEALDEAIAAREVDLAMIDLTGFDARLWERCAELQQHEIPFVLLSPRQVATGVMGAAEGKLGEYPVMTKPLSMQAFLSTVSAMLGEGG